MRRVAPCAIELSQLWEDAGRPKAGSRPGEGDEIGRTPEGGIVRRYAIASLLSGGTGSIDDFVIWAGQSVGLVNDIRPASEIVTDLVREASETLARSATRTG